MLETTIQFLFAPVLAALSTLACRRWGARIGGIVSAFPAIEILLRIALTAMLVAILASGASLLGPLLGGMLAALPVLASVLAVQTHRPQGTAAWPVQVIITQLRITVALAPGSSRWTRVPRPGLPA